MRMSDSQTDGTALNAKTMNKVRRRKGDSAFLAWFEEQHGTRHQAGEYDSRTDAQLEKAMMQGEVARRIWMQRQQWDARRQSALYAWCARDSTRNLELIDSAKG